MTRILHAVHAFAPEPMGGTERHVLGLAKAQRERGHEVTIVAGTMQWRHRIEVSETTFEGLRVLRIHRDDFHFERWHRTYHPGVSARFEEILQRARPDVVHVHHWLRLSLDLAQRAAACGIPVLVSLHDSFATCPTIHRVLPEGALCAEPAIHATCARCLGTEYPDADALDAATLALRQTILMRELQVANRVMTLSRSQAQRLASLVGGVELHVQPFTTFVRLRAAPRPAPPPPLRIATFGHVNPAKAQHVLLEAVRGLPDPALVEVHVFGGIRPESYAERLRELASGLKVELHGEYEYATLERLPLHLVVLTSLLPETYGLVLDEAKLLGVPAIVTGHGAYPERLGGGGLCVPPGDVLALRRVLQRALEEPGLVATLAREVRPPLTPERLLDELDALYGDAMAEGARPCEEPWRATSETLAFARADALERVLHAERARQGKA